MKKVIGLIVLFFVILVAKNTVSAQVVLWKVEFKVVEAGKEVMLDELQRFIPNGETANEPSDPEYVGYTWHLEGDADKRAFDFSTPITESIVLVGEKKKEYVSLSFETNGGTVVPSQKIIKGGVGTRPQDPTRGGYEFVGWYDGDLRIRYNFSTVLNEDKVVYAKWEEYGITDPTPDPTPDPKPEPKPDPQEPPKVEKNIKVIFISNGGTKVLTQHISKGARATEPKEPLRNGYKFAGWHKEEQLKQRFNFETKLYEDTYLYAKWEKTLPQTRVNNYAIIYWSILFIISGCLLVYNKKTWNNK